MLAEPLRDNRRRRPLARRNIPTHGLADDELYNDRRMDGNLNNVREPRGVLLLCGDGGTQRARIGHHLDTGQAHGSKGGNSNIGMPYEDTAA